MSRCIVCADPRRLEIERALLTGGASGRDVARRFSLSRSAVARHAQNHLPGRVRAACAGTATDPADTALAHIATAMAADVATLRSHVLRDLERIESIIVAEGAAGRPMNVLAAIRTKSILLARAGMAEDADRRIDGRRPDMSREDERIAVFEHAATALAELIHIRRPVLIGAPPVDEAENDEAAEP